MRDLQCVRARHRLRGPRRQPRRLYARRRRGRPSPRRLREAAGEVALDGGFASRSNLDAIKARGVTDVAFAKGRGIEVTEMVKNSTVYRRLRNFRAGIEAGISFLKRAFGLGRCTWRSLASFKSYVWSSVVAANLLPIWGGARHVPD